MRSYQWTISRDRKVLATGTIDAASEREAMGMVLATQGEGKEPDACYSVRVGDSVMSSFGDEFTQSAEVTSWGKEDDIEMGDRPFDPVTDAVDTYPDTKLKDSEEITAGAIAQSYGDHQDRQREFDMPSRGSASYEDCPIDGQMHDMNGEATNPSSGLRHAQCTKCSVIDPMPLRPPSGNGAHVLGKHFGSNLRPAQLDFLIHAIMSYGHEPEQVVSVQYEPAWHAHRIEGRCFDPTTGQEKVWAIRIDDVQLISLN